METGTNPVAKAGMLIRRPVGEVFEAFADPAITSKFWFSKGSGRLEPGARLRWDWEMYGVGSDVLVKAVEPGRRILIDWDLDNPTEVEWTFTPRGPEQTWVEVENRGFAGSPEERIERALDFDRRLRFGAGRRQDLARTGRRSPLRPRPPSRRRRRGLAGPSMKIA